MAMMDFTDWAFFMGYVEKTFKILERISDKNLESLYYENRIGESFTMIENFLDIDDAVAINTLDGWFSLAGDDISASCYVEVIDERGWFFDHGNAETIQKKLTITEASSGAGWSKVGMTIEYPDSNVADSDFEIRFTDGTNIAMKFNLYNGKAYIYEGATKRVLQIAAADIDPTDEYEWEFWFDETNNKMKVYFGGVEAVTITGFDDYFNVATGALTEIHFITDAVSSGIDVYIDNIAVDWINTEFKCWLVDTPERLSPNIRGFGTKTDMIMRVDTISYPVVRTLRKGDTLTRTDDNVVFKVMDNPDLSEFLHMIKLIVRVDSS
jgi:hypothetical protein